MVLVLLRKFTSYVILPQALAVAMSGISANIIFLIKETSVVSIIALPDLVTFDEKLKFFFTYKTDELLFMLFMGYLCLILPLSLMLSFVEKRPDMLEILNINSLT